MNTIFEIYTWEIIETIILILFFIILNFTLKKILIGIGKRGNINIARVKLIRIRNSISQ